MRKLLFTFLVVLVAISASFAQTEKGRWTVGAQVGNVSYRSSTDRPVSNRTATVLLSPSAGYFVANNVAVGASLPVYYSFYRTQYSSVPTGTLRNTQLGLAPFVRVYVGTAKLRPFVSATVGFTQQWSFRDNVNTVGQYRVSDNFFTYGGSAGVAYFLNQNVSLDASLNYSGGDQTTVVNQINNGGTQPGTLGLTVGFRLFFGR